MNASDDRVDVHPMREADAPAPWRPTLRLIRQLRAIFGDNQTIDIPEMED